MKIADVIPILKMEINFARTPCGRSISEYAQDALRAAIEDTKNYENLVSVCRNCCIIQSSLLMASGCENCGGHDISTDVKESDIQ
jgi:hypothetical protein